MIPACFTGYTMSLTLFCFARRSRTVAGAILVAVILSVSVGCSSSGSDRDARAQDALAADAAEVTADLAGDMASDDVDGLPTDALDMAQDQWNADQKVPDQAWDQTTSTDSGPGDGEAADAVDTHVADADVADAVEDVQTADQADADQGGEPEVAIDQVSTDLDSAGSDVPDVDSDADSEDSGPLQGMWSDCLHITDYASSFTCTDYCQQRADVCYPSCGPAVDSNWYSAYFFDSEAACQANTSVIAATGCLSTFGMEAASNHMWGRCCCAGD